MAPQHLAHPVWTDTHACVLLQVRGKTRARPARECVPLLSRVALYVLEEQLHRRRCQAGGASRVRTGLQRLGTLLAPPSASCVHCPGSDTQCFAHLGSAL